MSCCRKSSGMAPDIQLKINDKLKEISKIYPGASVICILNPSSEQQPITITTESLSIKSIDLKAVIASLKRAAIQFASTFKQSGCPVIHITGETQLFSCYDLDEGDNILVFYSFVPAESFDITNADKDMFNNVINSLRLLLTGLVSRS